MASTLISGGLTVNQGRTQLADIIIENDTITDILPPEPGRIFSGRRIDASGKIVIPGVIDTHVHFRQPGLTHKGDIASESRAAAAGGVTSVLEMPNTNPATTDMRQWEAKNMAAEQSCAVNYSFFFGATADNLDSIRRLNPHTVCGVKLFMGSSTGGMLVDDTYTLSALFAESPVVISAHCEQEDMIRRESEHLRAMYPDATAAIHPQVRTAEACYRSSARAVELADKYGARLNVAHITTARELSLFDAGPLCGKKITAEVCTAHLMFSQDDYPVLGNLIKCNPAVKSLQDRDALRTALTGGKIDIAATDHAPHTAEEKSRPYWQAPSGMPMVQHSLCAMLQLCRDGVISMETLVEKMCHAPALRYGIEKRGFLRAGYKADIAIIDPAAGFTVSKENILYKCGWSPLEGRHFDNSVCLTMVNGRTVYENGRFDDSLRGEMLTFRN